MKKELMILALAALMPFGAAAQDGRMRTSSTIVADALAQLPSSNLKHFNNTMKELASTGNQGVVQMANMLVPADKGKNATIEYALNGLVAYISQKGLESEKQAVTQGLIQALKQCKDNPNRAFLMTLLQKCADKKDVQVFIDYLNDDYLAEWAVNGILAVPNTEDILLDLIKGEKAPKTTLAYATGVKKLTAAEPILLGWLPNADKKTQVAIYKALGECGTSASLPALAEAAEAVDFEWESSDATNSYINLIYNLVENGEKEAADAEAKKLLKKTDKTNLQGAALKVILGVNKKEALPFLAKALKSENRDYRVNALRLVEPFADEETYELIGKRLKPKSEKMVQADIMNWAGSNHIASMMPLIVKKFQAENNEIAQAAIKAAGKIGGELALKSLIELLGGPRTEMATEALLCFNGEINAGILKALDGALPMQEAALKIASIRHMDEAAPKVFSMTQCFDTKVKEAAYNALPNVVRQNDFNHLTELSLKGDHLDKIQLALKNAIVSLPADKQLDIVLPYANEAALPYLYYPALAQIGNEKAINEIVKGYKGEFKDEALKALLTVDNEAMINQLFELAMNDKTNAGKIINRYAQLVSRTNYTPVRKYQLYRKALENVEDVPTQNMLIRMLGNTYTYQAFNVVCKYMQNKETANSAANAVRTILSKNPENLGGEPVREAIESAILIYKAIGDADAGYAVDELKGKLAKLNDTAYVPMFTNQTWEPIALNPAEKAKTRTSKAKAAEKKAVEVAKKVWEKTENGMKYAGGEKSTLGVGNYENFELSFEWKGKGAIGVRSIPQIDLGGALSGAVSTNETDNKPGVKANNCCCEWNTAYIKVVNDRITIQVNGKTTAENVTLENSCDRKSPVYEKGQILLIGEDSPIEFREMYIRELPSTPVFTLSKEEKKAGFEVLFDGKDMHKWIGNKTNYVPVDGAILVDAQYGGQGNLYTKKEYSDFVYRFEFCFLREGVNNGIGIRTPMNVDAAYHGMEIQVLDHDAPIYKDLHIYQQHGSVYGVIPAKHVHFEGLNIWNTEEIRAVGDHITVTVNGQVIVDGNIREACKGKNVAENGGKSGTIDGNNHPGLFNKKGHIAFCGHGAGIKFRNVRILDLSKK